jgi:uncharacterized protein with PIN domain
MDSYVDMDGSYISNENSNKRRIEDNDQMNKKMKFEDEHHVCVTCQATFVNASNLRHHVESYHLKSNSWSCAQCGKVSFF